MTIENGTLVTMRDAKVIWRNFEGRATIYKEAGPDARSFNVILDEDLAKEFMGLGLNVRTKAFSEDQAATLRAAGYNVMDKIGDDPDEPARHTLQIAVGYKIKPPRVVMLTTNSRVNLGEDSVSVIDWADIEKVDLIFRAAHWSNASNTKGGVKCWLKTMFVTINEDELEAEYGINDVSTAGLEEAARYVGEDMAKEPF